MKIENFSRTYKLTKKERVYFLKIWDNGKSDVFNEDGTLVPNDEYEKVLEDFNEEIKGGAQILYIKGNIEKPDANSEFRETNFKEKLIEFFDNPWVAMTVIFLFVNLAFCIGFLLLSGK